MTPLERDIVRDWAVHALAGVVAEGSIRWSYQDHPVNLKPYCTLREIGDSRRSGTPYRTMVTIDNVTYQRTREVWDCQVEIQVTAKADDLAPTLAQYANAIVSTAIRHLYTEAVGVPYLTNRACSVISVDGPLDLTYLEAGSQQTSRAAVTITFGFARLWDEQIDALASVEATGTITSDDNTLTINVEAEA